MQELLKAQIHFAHLVGKLLTYATETAGVPLALGEVVRSRAEAAANAARGVGTWNSLHIDGLALDVKVYRLVGGLWVWLDKSEEPEYAILGAYWKSLDPMAAWGGDFTTRRDAGHFSLMTGDGRR